MSIVIELTHLFQVGLKEEKVFERQCLLMAGVPEFGMKDMATWFRFVVLNMPILLDKLQVNLQCVVLI